MKKILQKVFLLIIVAFIQYNPCQAQVVYNMVIGGSNISINSSNGYDGQDWGGDPNSFNSNCENAQHDFQAWRSRGYLSTELPGGSYTYNNYPNGKPYNINIIASGITPGSYKVEDHFYQEYYVATRYKECSKSCDCNDHTVGYDIGAFNDAVNKNFTINVESSPAFKAIKNFDKTSNLYSVCSLDSAFSLSTLVDKSNISFLITSQINGFQFLLPIQTFDPKQLAPKVNTDTTYDLTFVKSYDNGNATKSFKIKVTKSAEITTSGSLSEFNVCKNIGSFKVTNVIIANPLGGEYTYNGSPVDVLYTKDFSSSKIDITYTVKVGLCQTQKTVGIVFKNAPPTENITSIGTFCNNLKNLPLKSNNNFPYFINAYDLKVGKKASIVRGSPALKTVPIGTPATASGPTYIPNVYDTLQLSKLSEGTFQLYYDIKDLSTGCISTDTFNVTIKAPAAISAKENIQVCNENLFYVIGKDVLPKGGKFTSSSPQYIANDSTLNISKMPFGKNVVKYTYTTPYSCVSSQDIPVSILERPNVIIPADTTFCEKSPEKKFNALPLGGTWTGLGITTDGVFTPSILQADVEYKLTYSLAIGSCSDSKYVLVNILKRPDNPEIIGAKSEYCTGDSVNLFATVANSSGLKYNWYRNDETLPFSKATNLNIIADKNLKRLLAETINSKGCASVTRTEKRFLINEVKVSLTLDKDSIERGKNIFLSTTVAGDQIDKVLWNFGDGTSGIGTNVVHYYYDTGRVVVKAKVLTIKGCAITKYADTIKVKGKPHQINTAANYFLSSLTDDSENYLEVYPNPSFDGKFNVFIYLPEGKNEILVQDILGETVFTKKINQLQEMEIDLSGSTLKSGMYFLRLNDVKGKNRIYKIIKK